MQIQNNLGAIYHICNQKAFQWNILFILWTFATKPITHFVNRPWVVLPFPPSSFSFIVQQLVIRGKEKRVFLCVFLNQLHVAIPKLNTPVANHPSVIWWIKYTFKTVQWICYSWCWNTPHDTWLIIDKTMESCPLSSRNTRPRH